MSRQFTDATLKDPLIPTKLMVEAIRRLDSGRSAKRIAEALQVSGERVRQILLVLQKDYPSDKALFTTAVLRKRT